MKILFMVLLILGALRLETSSAVAQSPETQINRYIKTCDQARSNLEIKYCLRDQYKYADGELNRVWKHVLSMIRKSGLPRDERATWKHKLKTAQRHWVNFKTAECEGAVPYKYWRGTQAGIAGLQCLIQLTVTRTHALQDYLNEG